MTNKSSIIRRIHALDFAIHEVTLFLASHPTDSKAMELLNGYRKERENTISQYEKQYGKYIIEINDVPTGNCWEWLKGPWPWENDFTEEF